ncbi:MAG: hypothetical protein ACJ786_40335, partial [Catenulispora sp.]
MPHNTFEQLKDDEQALILARGGAAGIPVRHGQWSAEVRGDEVADICFAGVPLLRAIRPVIRDRDWNTVPVRVEAMEHSPDGLTAMLAFRDDEVGFDGRLRLLVDRDRLTVILEATSTQQSWTNRTGLVVLHRPDDAGSTVSVRHTDGTLETGTWPVDISPHQPFHDVAGFRWIRDGVQAELSLDGEVFETEDQRNWTDASYKTYGTPLSRPFPVLHRPGDTIRQTATVSARVTEQVGHTVAGAGVVRLTPTVVGSVPPIGLGAALFPPPHLVPGPRRYAAVLVELTADEQQWPELLTAAADQAAALDCGLDVRIVTDRPEAVSRVVGLLGGRVIRIGAFDPTGHISTAALWQALRSAVQTSRIEAQLVGGTRAHFTELNRRRDDIPADVDQLTFSLTPQMHASEVPHIVDSLTAQRTVALNAVRLADGRPVHVGPITLTRRFNAVATTPPPDPAIDAQRATDPLLATRFAGAWTLGSIAALSVPGISSLCYFEAAGPRGIDQDGVRTQAGQVLDTFADRAGLPVL